MRERQQVLERRTAQMNFADVLAHLRQTGAGSWETGKSKRTPYCQAGWWKCLIIIFSHLANI